MTEPSVALPASRSQPVAPGAPRLLWPGAAAPLRLWSQLMSVAELLRRVRYKLRNQQRHERSARQLACLSLALSRVERLRLAERLRVFDETFGDRFEPTPAYRRYMTALLSAAFPLLTHGYVTARLALESLHAPLGLAHQLVNNIVMAALLSRLRLTLVSVLIHTRELHDVTRFEDESELGNVAEICDDLRYLVPKTHLAESLFNDPMTKLEMLHDIRYINETPIGFLHEELLEDTEAIQNLSVFLDLGEVVEREDSSSDVNNNEPSTCDAITEQLVLKRHSSCESIEKKRREKRLLMKSDVREKKRRKKERRNSELSSNIILTDVPAALLSRSVSPNNLQVPVKSNIESTRLKKKRKRKLTVNTSIEVPQLASKNKKKKRKQSQLAPETSLLSKKKEDIA